MLIIGSKIDGTASSQSSGILSKMFPTVVSGTYYLKTMITSLLLIVEIHKR
jgi:hypothetical protein